jgi:hypothetical protein
MTGDASCEPQGEISAYFLTGLRQDMRNELASHITSEKKITQDIGCRALRRIKRTAETEADLLADYVQKAITKAVEEETARQMKKQRTLPMDAGCLVPNSGRGPAFAAPAISLGNTGGAVANACSLEPPMPRQPQTSAATSVK